MIAEQIAKTRGDKTKVQGIYIDTSNPCHLCANGLIAMSLGYRWDGTQTGVASFIEKTSNGVIEMNPLITSGISYLAIKGITKEKAIEIIKERFKQNGTVKQIDLVYLNDYTDFSFEELENLFRELGI